MTHRIDNFFAGPCTLPLSVLQQVQAEFTDFHGSGMSIVEISHRNQLFEPLHNETLALAGTLLGMPEDFQCLLLTGGASMQFAMTAMNLMADGSEGAIINSGIWGNKAMAEAKRIGTMHEAWSGKSSDFTRLPDASELTLPKQARYLHVTANETVDGLEFSELPKVDIPMVVDASSNYFTQPIPWDRCDIVYGGAQKNLAPSGITVVFVRKSLLKEQPNLPKILNYKTHADANSLYNTIPTFQVYVLNLVLKWIKEKGGISYFNQFSHNKSAALYQKIDQSDFYHNDIEKSARSKMNVIFRTPSSELDTLFWKEAEKAGMIGLKGHRLVGGLRASLYNALEMKSVTNLITFMDRFEKAHA